MNDHYKILGETVDAIRLECEERLKAMSDKLLAAEIEATMAKSEMRQARLAEQAAAQVTTKLLTQFALVSKVFDEARVMALQIENPVREVDESRLPKVNYNEEGLGGMTLVDRP